MYTRVIFLLTAVLFLSVAGVAAAGTRLSNSGLLTLRSDCQLTQSCAAGQGDNGHHYGVNGSEDQGDDNGQHKDRGHHFGEGANDHDQDHDIGLGKHNADGGGSSGSGGSGGNGGTGTGSGSGSPSGGGGTGVTGGSVSVPEPATLALLSLGLLGCAVRLRRR
ncbi:MAG: PEP-CTERM sorting domain-containing protein [Proteobacteria bacterium]|nr:PEP-CTERM sorting domain-containing protein [Pseudomonadota bacterium]